MGARVYDPTTRSFLSVDPLAPTTGAGWAGNPYAYAGNDPLHALDPLGLHPVTDAELRAYNANNGGLASAVGHWAKDNWEYVAGGAMVIAGGVLIATGVGGPAGMMLVSAGADTIIQKATTGRVNWGEVAVTGVIGGISGPGAGLAERAGLAGWKAAAAAAAIDGAWQGGATSGVAYLTGPGPHTTTGLLQATGVGTLAGGTLGAASRALETAASREPTPYIADARLGDVRPVPATEDDRTLTRVLFRADTRGPEQIFNQGFRPKGNNMNLLLHATRNPPDSGFVSTSRSLASAREIARDVDADYIYKLHGTGRDVNGELGPRSPFPFEKEVAIPGHAEGTDIEGAWGPDDWQDNPDFQR